MANKSAIVASEFYQTYIQKIKEEDPLTALEKNTRQFAKFLQKIPRKKIDYAYGEGKWTIREVLQHLIDAERIFGYRALRFARKDETPLPGFDENTFVTQSGASSRKWKDLVNEFLAQRRSTTRLFESFTDDQWTFTGSANGVPMNTIAIGFIIPGHTAHHMQIIKERYLEAAHAEKE